MKTRYIVIACLIPIIIGVVVFGINMFPITSKTVEETPIPTPETPTPTPISTHTPIQTLTITPSPSPTPPLPTPTPTAIPQIPEEFRDFVAELSKEGFSVELQAFEKPEWDYIELANWDSFVSAAKEIEPERIYLDGIDGVFWFKTSSKITLAGIEMESRGEGFVCFVHV